MKAKRTTQKPKKQPMTQLDHEDDCTLSCPCGASARVSEPEDHMEFVAEHRRHTNGKLLVQADGSWCKFFSEQPKDYTVSIK